MQPNPEAPGCELRWASICVMRPTLRGPWVKCTKNGPSVEWSVPVVLPASMESSVQTLSQELTSVHRCKQASVIIHAGPTLDVE